jgi:uncharacterized membrane protein
MKKSSGKAGDKKKPPVVRSSRFEDFPLTRQEYLSVMVHFYRGEIHRSITWRTRTDATTNWTILATAGMLSFAFSSPNTPHIVVLLSNLVIISFLNIESRRYRYFEVYRARVRMLEENFLIPIITRQLESPMGSWREMVAMDLDLPKYKTSYWEAIGFRLRRNYVWIFMIVLGAWVLKLAIHPTVDFTLRTLWTRMHVGSLTAWVVLVLGVVFYVAVFLLIWVGRHLHGGEPDDEIAGLERNLEYWKL